MTGVKLNGLVAILGITLIIPCLSIKLFGVELGPVGTAIHNAIHGTGDNNQAVNQGSSSHPNVNNPFWSNPNIPVNNRPAGLGQGYGNVGNPINGANIAGMLPSSGNQYGTNIPAVNVPPYLNSGNNYPGFPGTNIPGVSSGSMVNPVGYPVGNPPYMKNVAGLPLVENPSGVLTDTDKPLSSLTNSDFSTSRSPAEATFNSAGVPSPDTLSDVSTNMNSNNAVDSSGVSASVNRNSVAGSDPVVTEITIPVLGSRFIEDKRFGSEVVTSPNNN